MTGGIFEDASMVSTVVRVHGVAASVAWYREKLGLEPIHVGADGPAHPHRRLWDRRFGGFAVAASGESGAGASPKFPLVGRV